ncbi:unnamed protein product [Callosobruchus maculatus]|uniref:C2H2-type domain-containing protein n=1 Tax=Callosobruchus maculatus TaxID=64391 RepID=A0A653CKG4_CALMS|nr:unnamed protein product [Callosobruchus maculatus]
MMKMMQWRFLMMIFQIQLIDPSPPPPPKKKYKISHRKSADGNADREVLVLKTITNRNAENTLELDCWVEPLEEVQENRLKKLQAEEKEMEEKLKQLLSSPHAKLVHKGDLTTIVEVSEQVNNALTAAAKPPPPAPVILNNSGGSQYQLMMDPRLGLVLGQVTTPAAAAAASPPTPTTAKSLHGKVTVAQNLTQPKSLPTTPNQTVAGRTMRTRRGGKAGTRTPPPATPPTVTRQVVQNKATPPPQVTPPTRSRMQLQQQQMQTPPVVQTPPSRPQRGQAAAAAAAAVAYSNARPSENNVEGGLMTGTNASTQGKKTRGSVVVDLTAEDGRANAPDSREISFNKLQGKTYPSLVVVARPHLRATADMQAERPKLDAKVKSVLMHPPTKFTEWLIQQGLVKSEQKCSVHTNNQLKLGMYSDVSKFPYSGGYVWISECCPQRFVSVFSGSLFEGSPHPPMVILKLLYHWSCQTNIQNVTQWVKVDNLYVKGMYTWLRAICTVGLQSHLRKIGGPGIKVEIGVISLGTTSQDGNQRQVKVEVLGVLETATKLIRLRAVEPQADGDRNYKKRFSKILEPVFQWVHPQSIIVADLTVDKQTLHQMGFQHVVQSTSSEYGNNRAIMDYLRRIVPRMFQNTLSLLSRQIIQQFLDELVWREWYGTNAHQAFNHLVQHLSEQTRHDSGMSLIVRLNKVAQNPFKNWSIPIAGGGASTQSSGGAASKGNAATPTSRGNVTTAASPAGANSTDGGPPAPKKARAGRPPKVPPDAPKAVQQQAQEVNRPPKSTSPDVPEQMVPLENYYYGTIDTYSKTPRVVLNMKCPFCKSLFDNNIQLMSHLFKHAHNVSQDAQLCRYCLTSVPTAGDLLKHIASSHPAETKFDSGFVCLICETQYMNPFILGKHMSKEHCPSELPYQCGTCGYRCSNHKQAIDHFYRTHDHGPTIQCPFCLKSTTVFSSSRNITQNVNYFIQHLQKHQRKQYAKRCGKCNLWFVQKDVLKDHQMRMHVSQRGKQGLVPWLAPRNGVMVPKSKMDKYPGDADVINFDTLRYNVPKDLVCKECSQPLDAPKHFPSFESCQNPNCQYSTCCTNAMQEHNAKCNKTGNPVAVDILPFEMHCICGFCSTDGNQMAKHLAICEKKSAYPSKVKAKAATVTHSMLDVLGLVRKPGEGQTVSRNKATRTRKPEPVVDEKKTKKEEKVIKQEKEASSTTQKDASDKAGGTITEDAVTADKTQTEAAEKADVVAEEKMDTEEADKGTEKGETQNEMNESAPEENEDRSASKADEEIPDKTNSKVDESDTVENREEDSSKADVDMNEDSSSKMETNEIEDKPSSTIDADDNPNVDAPDSQNDASESQNEAEAPSEVDAEDSSKVDTTDNQNELSSQLDASESQNEEEEASKIDTAENEDEVSSQVEASETQNEAEESPKVDTSENQEEVRSEVDASEGQHENASENQYEDDTEAAEPQDEIESADKESEEKVEDNDQDIVEGENEEADTQKDTTDGTEETEYVEDAKEDENLEVTKDENAETESNEPIERQSNVDEDETQSSQGGESAAVVESEARATEESQDEPEAYGDENARDAESPGLEDSTRGSADVAEKDVQAEDSYMGDNEVPQVDEGEPQGEDESAPKDEAECPPPVDSEPSDLQPTENSLEKGNCIEGEITSDDIQNLISDMVGDKQSMNFDEGSQSMGATQSMERDFGSERSKQMADMSVESMEECMNLADGRAEDQPTPMETDQ